MAGDLDKFLAEVRAESTAAGPAAVDEFAAYLRHFELSRQVFELRKAHRWSQLQLAKQSGVQQSEISRIEHGQGNPTYQTLAALAGAMQMQLAFVPSTARRDGTRRKAQPAKPPGKNRSIAAGRGHKFAEVARRRPSAARSARSKSGTGRMA